MESNVEVPQKEELPDDPAIPLLGIYWKKMKSLAQKDICTSVFIGALFTASKTWKSPKCSLTDEWIKIVVYIVEYYSAIRRRKSCHLWQQA